MYFISTRGNEKVTGAQAIVQGLAKDGGLFVPETFPAVSPEEIGKLTEMNYPERAAFIIGKYLGEFGEDFLKDACTKAYSSFEATRSARQNRSGTLYPRTFPRPDLCVQGYGAHASAPAPQKELGAHRHERGSAHFGGDERRYGQSGTRRIPRRGRDKGSGTVSR